MIRITRVLPAAMATVALVGSGIQASAAGAGFTATVTPNCVVAGQHLTVTGPHLFAGTVVSIRASYTDSATGGGTQYLAGYPNAQGVFTATIPIPSTASAGNGSLTILLASPIMQTSPGSFEVEAELGTGTFQIQNGTGACPSPGQATIFGSHFSSATAAAVKKTCDAGVSGNAVFAMSATIGEAGRFVFPPVTLACNGPEANLPALPTFASTVTLHEATPATGAIAAADTVFTLPPSSDPVTIHNAKATAAVTPTPVVTLARTGGGTPSGLPLWPGLLVGALVASTVAWIFARVSRRRT
jgi:hypothetical protein